MSFMDLREWLAVIEKQNSLRRIAAPVDWDREIGVIPPAWHHGLIDSQKVSGSLNTILERELAGVVRDLHYSLMLFGHARILIINGMRNQATEGAPSRLPSAPQGTAPAREAGRPSAHPVLLSAQILRHKIPVDQIPPCRDVIRPAILIFQIIGVLPDVQTKNRLLALHQRIVLIRRARDRQLAAVADEPGPA